jgi:hypothetical protein
MCELGEIAFYFNETAEIIKIVTSQTSCVGRLGERNMYILIVWENFGIKLLLVLKWEYIFSLVVIYL